MTHSDKTMHTVNRLAARGIFLLLLVLVGFTLADITWKGFTDRQSPKGNVLPIVTQTPQEQHIGYSVQETISSLKRFNPWEIIHPQQQAPPSVTQQPQHAVLSSLDLTLIGTMVLSPRNSRAIFVRKTGRGEQLTLFLGDEYQGAILDKIERNVVYFSRNGQYELIAMKGLADEMTDKKKGAAGFTPEAVLQRTTLVRQMNREHFASLLAKGKNILKGVNIAPYYQGSQSLGYQLHYQENNATFQEFGIASGDVVEKVNGVSVINTQAISKMVANMNNMSSIAIDLLHDGNPRTITVNIGN